MKRTFTFLVTIVLLSLLAGNNAYATLTLKINNNTQVQIDAIGSVPVCAGSDNTFFWDVVNNPPPAGYVLSDPIDVWSGSASGYMTQIVGKFWNFNCTIPGTYDLSFSAVKLGVTYTVNQTIVVYSKDNLFLDFPTVSPYEICEGSTVTLEASGTTYYYWQRTTDVHDVGFTATVDETPPGVGTWTYQVYGFNDGCNSNPEYIEFDIEVKEAATVDAGGPYTTCDGVGVVLNGSIGGSATSVTWSGGLGTFSDPSDLNATYTPDASEAGTTVNIKLKTDDPAGVCTFVEEITTVTVTINNTISLTSAVGTNNQTVCINNPITDITYSTTGATGATFSGLPAGVTGSWAADVVTITGTPTTSVGSPFNYTITLTGGCGIIQAGGTIIVNPDNTASAPSSTPTVCINTAIPNVTHTTTGATGIGAAVGLPAGVLASWAGNTITISGSPTASGTFNYTIPLTGGCGTVNATGTITVSPANTASAPSSTPTVCINIAIPNITHTTTGATGIGAAIGLPAGVSASWAGNTITIIGTPTASGTFNYTIPLTGGCSAVNATGTITVTPANTASAPSSTPTVCINTAIPNIIHTTTGATGIGAAIGLPAGVSASWAGNTITIIGTPTASGTFNYTIPLTGGCSAVNATGTITVTPANTASAPSSTPTVCINTAIPNITHTTTGATGIGAAIGLPAGVSASWAGNTITIIGTPTASGTFNYIIPLTGGCSVVNATGTITVTTANTASAPSSTPTGCINIAIPNITHTTTGATGIGAAVGLPAGVSASWAGNTITISGTPTASGTFNYTIPLTGGCSVVNATGTITVNPNNTASAPSSTPTVCINIAIPNITHTTTGATGIGAAVGLPAGVTASWAGNTITIIGTPTASGTFNYTIPLTGGCSAVNATGTITVTPANTASAPSSTPTVCINAVIPNITHTTTGAAGIGAAVGLPAGVTASWAGNTITIIGTPTASGTFNYTIPLTGGCSAVNATGTITVTPANTASAPSSTPTVCINTAIPNITHTTTGATGIGATVGLPAGVTANWAGNTITISGTPTASGTFNYTIPLTGGCSIINATGTITVTPNNTVSAPSSTPTTCINTAIPNITHTTTGATGIGAATGLPAGVTASWAGNTITITGTPTASGTFNYTIPLTGGCSVVNATGTITVTTANTASAPSSTPTGCINIAIPNITHTTTGATGIGAAVGLPAGVTANWAGNTITISGTPSVSGTFNYSIPLSGGCGTINATGTITVVALPTITLTNANPSICYGATSANITYSITTGSANQYSITYSPAALAEGFIDVVDIALPASPIVITVPGAANAGTYNANLTVRNSLVGCSSVNYPITITIGLPFTITGFTTLNPICNGLSTGEAEVNHSGGIAPISYSWSTIPIQTTKRATGLQADVLYTVLVTDADLCTATGINTVILTQPAVISIVDVTPTNVDMCYGDTNGAIEVLATGGTPNYTYSLYDGVNFISSQTPIHPIPANFVGLGAGTNYRVVVTDANNCTPAEQSGIEITQPDELIITGIDVTNITCNGYNDGTITINVTGGTPPYEFSLDGPFPFGTFFPTDVFSVGEGGYDIYVRDANGCETGWPVQITLVNPPAISFSYNINQITSCNGAPDGSINITNVSGGSGGGYLFSISEPPVWGNISDFTGLLGGPTNPYYIRVMDSEGCIETANNGNPVFINQPSPITFNIVNVINVTGCWYNTNGSFRVQNALGGTGIKQVTIDGGLNWFSVPRNFTNLGVALYTVTVRDANGCEVSQTVNITGPAQIVLNPPTVVDVSCHGGSDGEITVSASGGTGLLEYSIDGGAFGAVTNFTGLLAGTHTIRVRDANDCILSQDVVIAEPNALIFNKQESTDITCNGLVDGTITLEVSGGTAPYEFSITGTPPFTSNTGLYTGLSAGNYPVVVRDANGCITFGSTLVIAEPAVIAITGEVSQDILCFGGTASITITATGGTGVLTYNLVNNLSVVVASNTTGVFTGILEGTYTVEVDDENGCGPVPSSVFTFTEPDEITIDPVIVITQISCFGNTDGEIAVTATGTGDLFYTLLESGNPITTQTNDGTFSGLVAGSYTVSVTDDNSCGPKVVGPFDIASPAELTLSTEVINVSCSTSGNDGIIRATGNGGTAPYHIILLLGGVQQADFTNVAEGVEVEFTGLAGAPNYEVEIRDANYPTCSAVLSGLLNLIVPDELTIGAPAIVNPGCIGEANATVTIQAAGGTLPYTYTLFDSGNNQIGAPIISATADAVEFNGLIAGTYYITVDDANGCGPVQTTPNFDITNPVPIVFTPFKTDMNCYGSGVGTGTITINITSGGVAPFEFSVNGGLIYTTDNPVTGLSGGDYGVMVRDANGCLSDVQTVNIFEPDELTLTLEGFDVSCNGNSDGLIIATSTGGTFSGTSPKQYSLDVSGLWTTSSVFNNVSAGPHTVIVKDANGCETTETITIGEPDPITILTVDFTDPTCTQPGTITVTAEGGTNPLVYTLQPGGATSSTGEFTNLGGNIYTVEVSDINGCPSDITGSITLTSPSLITIDDVIITDATGCFGSANNGVIEIIASGGAGTLTYSINGGIPVLTNIFSDLEPGDYNIVVNDDNGDCPQFQSVTVGGPAEITYNILVEQAEDPTGAANGVIFVLGSGGTGILTYNLWENTAGFITSNATGQFENLTNGTYWVVITDENDCPVTTILIPLAGILVIPNVTDVDCNGYLTGAIDLTISGGTPPYTITWTGPSGALPAFDNMEDITGLEAGTYSVHVEDIDGLFVDLNIDVAEPVALSLPTQIPVSPTCHPSQGGTNNGSITAGAAGGTPPYTYYLEDSNGLPVDNNTTGVFTDLWADLYGIEVVDGNGCTLTLPSAIEIAEPIALSYDIEIIHPINHTTIDGQIIVTAHGGSGSYTYTLLPDNINSPSGVFTDLPSGLYHVVITDGLGCSITITDIRLFGITVILEPNHISCFGANDGWINVITSTLLDPYTISLFWIDGDQFITGGLSPDSKILAPGDYIVTVKSGGNEKAFQTTIFEPTQIVATVVQVENPGCFGAETGFVIFDISEGTPFADGYDISWDGGSSRGFVAQPLGAGTYNFTITDANGCSIPVPDVVVITAPESMELISLNVFNPACFGQLGYISMQVSGGAEPITYTVDGPNGPVLNNDGIFNDLPAGTYFIDIEDANGCQYLFEEGNRVIITQPEEILITTLTNVIPELDCWYSTADIVNMQVGGGTPDYTYLWSNGQVSLNLISPTPGYYTMKVTDSQGCEAFKEVAIPGPTRYVFDYTTHLARCRVTELEDEGAINISRLSWDVVPTGPAEFIPYSSNDFSISWAIHSGNILEWNTWYNLPEYDNLWELENRISGNYMASIIDPKGCKDTTYFRIHYNEDNYFELSVAQDDSIYCYDVTANLLVSTNKPIGDASTYTWFKVENDLEQEVHTGNAYAMPNLQAQTVHNIKVVSEVGCLESILDTLKVHPPIRPYLDPLIHPFYVPNNVYNDDSVISVLSDTEYEIQISTETDDIYEFSFNPVEFFDYTEEFVPTMFFQSGIYESYLQTTGLINQTTMRPEPFIPLKIMAKKTYTYWNRDQVCADSLLLKARILNKINIPNVFTPNGDGLNDRWIVPYSELFSEIEVYVYNRWGYTIWEGKGVDVHKGWDGNNSRGTAYPTGTYYYVVKFNIDGNTNWKAVSGSVTILR